jgi:hypothetical protein
LAANTLSRDGAEFILIYSQGKYFVIKQYLASHSLQTHSRSTVNKETHQYFIKPLPRFPLESGNYFNWNLKVQDRDLIFFYDAGLLVGRAGLLRDVPVLRGHVPAAGRQVPHCQAHDLQLPGRHPLRRHVALPLGCLELHPGEVFYLYLLGLDGAWPWLGSTLLLIA